MLGNYLGPAMPQLFAGTVLAQPFRSLRGFKFARNLCFNTQDEWTRPCHL